VLAALARTGASFAQPFYDEYSPECSYSEACDCGPGYATGYCEPQCGEPYFGGAWFGAEYLRWRIEGEDPLPPLVTDAPANSTSNLPGALGNPDTRILYGNETVNEDWRNGFRLYGGVWFDCCQCCGLSADYFDTDNDDFFISDPNSGRIVARPFFNTETGVNDRQLVDQPGVIDGTVSVDTGDDFSGAGIALQRTVWRCCDPCGCGPSSQVYMLGGYRHYRYDSDLVITEDLEIIQFADFVPGTTILLQDKFFTENEFHGGEVGFQGVLQQSCWWVDGLFKVAVGSHRRVVTIDGQTTFTVPNGNGGTVETLAGGLLTAEATNIGRYADNTIAVIPELRVGVGAQLTCNVSVRAGYGIIFWNAVARAGSQLPPGLEVDPRNLPNADSPDPAGPEPEFAGILGNSLVAHGFDLGIQFTY
jgi:hypothetical protein